MSGFFTGFATGFANRASDISQENERQRNRNIERAMERMSAVIERRQERLYQQRAAARLVAQSGLGVSENDAQGMLAAGVPMSDIMSGRYSVETPTQEAPGQPSGGLMQPPGSALPGAPTEAPTATTAPPVAMPNAAPAPTPTDPRDAVAASAQDSPGIMQRVGSAMFGRDPFQGVDAEVRQRYMRDSGMTEQQMNELLNPEAPQIQGNYRYNQFTPEMIARMSQSFRDEAGRQRFIESGGRDQSGLLTGGDLLQNQLAVAAARNSGRGQGVNINTSHYNAALRAFGTFLPQNSLIRPVVGPNGEISISVNIPSNNPRYAEAQRQAATAMQALSAAINGRVEGIAPGDPFLAAEYAARQVGLAGNNNPRIPPPQPNQQRQLPALSGNSELGQLPQAPTDAPRAPAVAAPDVAPRRVSSIAEAQALPPETVFIDPNGVTRTR